MAGRVVTVTLNPALDVSTEVEAVTPGVKLRCAPPRVDPGGGGVNVSRALRRLGGTSLAAVAAGGPAGERLLGLLRAEGLDPAALPVAAETRTSVAVTAQDDGAQYRFVMPGPAWSAADASAAAEAVRALARTGDLVVVSGSLPPGVAPDWPLALAHALRAAGARTLLDTSGPALAAAASGPSALYALRMDGEEAAALAGAPLPDAVASAAFAAGLAAQGVATVVTAARGAEGAVAVDATGRWWRRPPKVPVVSAVGAGDSFVAAFAGALAEDAGVEAALTRAVAAAAAAVTTPDTRLCDAETYRAILPQVTAGRL